MIAEIHHIGLAVRDLDSAVDLYTRGFGMTLARRDRSDSEDMEYALLRGGDAEIELMHSNNAESPVGKFLAQRGEGVHHVAYGVSDFDASLATLRGSGMQLAGEPRNGVHGTRVVFVHPRSVGGVLTELVEVPRREAG